MSTVEGGIARYDINDPEDLAYLIRTGLIWKGGPTGQQLAVRALQSGAVPRPNNLPPQVAAVLDASLRAGEPESPAEDTAEPGEEPA